jgi:putative ATP-binding cassette transporter
MPLLILLAKRSWLTLLVATATGLVCGLAASGLIALINQGISDLKALEAQSVWPFIGLALVVVITRVIADISLIQLGQRAINDLRLHLSNKLVDTPYRQLQQLGKHKLLAMLTDDTQTISQAVEFVPVVLVNAGIMGACFIYLGWLSIKLLILTLVLIALGASAFHWPQKKALQSLSQARELKDGLFQHYRSLTDGSKELQLNHARRKHFFSNVLTPTSQSYKQKYIRGLSIYAAVLNWGNGLFYVLIGLVLFAAPQMLGLEASLITGYILTILYMITPLSELMNALPVLGRASIALDKVKTLESQLENQLENLTESSTTNQKLSHSQANTLISPNNNTSLQQLHCKEVSHTYYREREDGHFTLGPINLQLNAGELVFITGGNGGGKTTLALLLTGLYAPEQGDLLINDEVSSQQQPQQYREHFSAIFTDFCLFEDILNQGNEQQIQQARDYLKHLQLDHKVEIENGKLSTVELSTGQRKRLALLSAYLEDRPCYLFDEWAADQDPVFKNFFYTKILPDLKASNKLIIAITHDDAYFHLADRVLKVDQGQVLEITECSEEEGEVLEAVGS